MCPSCDPAMTKIAIEHIRVEADRVVFEVRLAAACPHRTTPAIARRALQERPNLARHACVNSTGRTFGVVIEDTPLPHLLEHVAIDMLVESAGDAHATFVGTSAWIDEPRGLARVQVSMHDDLAVLASFNRAIDFVNKVVRN